MAERSETFHKLLFLPSGRITLQCRMGSLEGGPGSLWIVPAGTRHRITDSEPSVVLLLCLGQSFLQDKSIALPLKVMPLGPITAQVENWWRRALHENTRPNPGQLAAQQAIALQILVAIARLNTPANPSPRERIRHLQHRVTESSTNHGPSKPPPPRLPSPAASSPSSSAPRPASPFSSSSPKAA